jgi:hypothetical protein
MTSEEYRSLAADFRVRAKIQECPAFRAESQAIGLHVSPKKTQTEVLEKNYVGRNHNTDYFSYSAPRRL